MVNEVSFSLESHVKELDSINEDILDQISKRTIDEQAIRRQIREARQRVIGLVERFFDGFEKEVDKSIA